MTPLVEQEAKKKPRILVLAEWPQSLLDAYRAGVLCGASEAEAKKLDTYHKSPHPWRQYRSRMTTVTNL